MKISLLSHSLAVLCALFPIAILAQKNFRLGESIHFALPLPPNMPTAGKWILEKPPPTDIEVISFQRYEGSLDIQLRSFKIDTIQQFELFFALIQGRDTFRLRATSPKYHFVSALTPEFRDYEGILYWHPVTVPIPWERFIIVLGVLISVLVVLTAIFKKPALKFWRLYRQKLVARARVRHFNKLLQQEFPQKVVLVNAFWRKELSSLLRVPFQSLTAKELAHWEGLNLTTEKSDLVQLIEIEEQLVYAETPADQAIFEKKCQTVQRLLRLTEPDHGRLSPKDGNATVA